jgi:hypothetical protein
LLGPEAEILSGQTTGLLHLQGLHRQEGAAPVGQVLRSSSIAPFSGTSDTMLVTLPSRRALDCSSPDLYNFAIQFINHLNLHIFTMVSGWR